jgi:hypothetical protein
MGPLRAPADPSPAAAPGLSRQSQADLPVLAGSIFGRGFLQQASLIISGPILTGMSHQIWQLRDSRALPGDIYVFGRPIYHILSGRLQRDNYSRYDIGVLLASQRAQLFLTWIKDEDRMRVGWGYRHKIFIGKSIQNVASSIHIRFRYGGDWHCFTWSPAPR